MTRQTPYRGDRITVNGRRAPQAIEHVRRRGEKGVVTSIDYRAAHYELPSIEVMFDTRAPGPDGTRFELFYPMEITTEE